MATKDTRFQHLPDCAEQYIRSVVGRIGNTLKVRREVCDELIDHFTHALRDCDEAERLAVCQKLIQDFGDAKLLAKLIRRGKKRCRPLWRKAITRSFQAAGLLIVFCCLYTLYLATGKPTISTDYLAILNARARPTIGDDQNAWPHYKRAIDLYVEPAKDIDELARRGRKTRDDPVVDFADLEASQQAAIRQWIEVNEPSWRELEAGSRKPHCWFEYSSETPDQPLFGLPLPFIRPLRSIVGAGIWRSRISLAEGDPGQASDQCLVVARVGRHEWSRAGFLMEQLLGIRASGDAYDQILRTLDAHKLSAPLLTTAQEQLAGFYPNGYPMVNLEGERLLFLDVVQHHFTEGGPGNGHLIPSKHAETADLLGHTDESGPILKLWLGAGRAENVSKVNEFFHTMAKVVKLSPYQRRAQGMERWSSEYVDALSDVRFPLLRMMLPAYTRAGEDAYRVKALHEATITVLAAKRWRLDKGQYPQDLNELLQAGYLKSLPADPYSDGPLRYERRGDDFLLYSVSTDFKDDGASEDDSGRRGSAEWSPRKLDHIFWPVQ